MASVMRLFGISTGSGVCHVNVNLACIGDVARHIGSPGFGRTLFNLFADALDTRFCAVFAFPSSGEPRVILSEGATPADCAIARKLAADYAREGYRSDPNLAARKSPGTRSIHRLRAGEVADSHYRQRFFEEPGVGYQLVHFSCLDGVLYCLSLSRDERRGCFHTQDVMTIRGLARFAVPAVHRHDAVDAESGRSLGTIPTSVASPVATLDTPAMRAHMRQVFLEAPHRLSPREAEVCAGIVLGYSTTAIGLNLRIAFNTVATHRKRAYKKLGVCTQNELFARYFENLKGMHAAGSRAAS